MPGYGVGSCASTMRRSSLVLPAGHDRPACSEGVCSRKSSPAGAIAIATSAPLGAGGDAEGPSYSQAAIVTTRCAAACSFVVPAGGVKSFVFLSSQSASELKCFTAPAKSPLLLLRCTVLHRAATAFSCPFGNSATICWSMYSVSVMFAGGWPNGVRLVLVGGESEQAASANVAT